MNRKKFTPISIQNSLFFTIGTLIFIFFATALNGSTPEKKDIPKIMEKIRHLEKPLEEIRLGLFCAICSECQEQEGTMEILSEYLHDKDERIRFTAAATLKGLKDPRAIPYLTAAQKVESHELVLDILKTAVKDLEECQLEGTQRFSKGQLLPRINLISAPEGSKYIIFPEKNTNTKKNNNTQQSISNTFLYTFYRNMNKEGNCHWIIPFLNPQAILETERYVYVACLEQLDIFDKKEKSCQIYSITDGYRPRCSSQTQIENFLDYLILYTDKRNIESQGPARLPCPYVTVFDKTKKQFFEIEATNYTSFRKNLKKAISPPVQTPTWRQWGDQILVRNNETNTEMPLFGNLPRYLSNIRQLVQIKDLLIARTPHALRIFKGNKEIQLITPLNGLFSYNINGLKTYGNNLMVIYNGNIDIFDVSTGEFHLLKRFPGLTYSLKNIHFNKKYLFYSCYNENTCIDEVVVESLKDRKKVFRKSFENRVDRLIFQDPILIINNKYTFLTVDLTDLSSKIISQKQYINNKSGNYTGVHQEFILTKAIPGYLLGNLYSFEGSDYSSIHAVIDIKKGYTYTEPFKTKSKEVIQWLKKIPNQFIQNPKPVVVAQSSEYLLEKKEYTEYYLHHNKISDTPLMTFSLKKKDDNIHFLNFMQETMAAPEGTSANAFKIIGNILWVATNNDIYSFQIKDKKWKKFPIKYLDNWNVVNNSLVVTEHGIFGRQYGINRDTWEVGPRNIIERRSKIIQVMVGGPDPIKPQGIAYSIERAVGYYNDQTMKEYVIPYPEPIGAIAFYKSDIVAAGANQLYIFDLEMKLVDSISYTQPLVDESSEELLPFTLEIEKNGIVWLGTDSILMRIDLNTKSQKRYELHFYGKDKFQLCDDDEYLWIFTNSLAGILRLDKKTEQIFSITDSTSCDDPLGLNINFTIDEGEYFYFGERNLYRLHKKTLNVQKSCLYFNCKINSMARYGDLYFLDTERGLIQLDKQTILGSFLYQNIQYGNTN